MIRFDSRDRAKITPEPWAFVGAQQLAGGMHAVWDLTRTLLLACALRAQRHISFYVYEYAIGLNMDAPVKEPANRVLWPKVS